MYLTTMYLVCIPRTAQARDLGAAAAVPLSIAASELSLGKQLSEGAESVVYEGVFRGQPVAVKKLRLSTSADLDRFRSELKLLAQLNHPNVVTLVGAHHGHCNMADKLDDWSRFSREIWGTAARRCQGSSSRLHGGAAAAAEQPAAHAV